MMAALSLIFMFNDSVSGGQTDAAGCNTAIQNQCDITGQEKVSVPTNCVNPNTEEVIDGIRYSKEGSKDGYSAEMDCSSG